MTEQERLARDLAVAAAPAFAAVDSDFVTEYLEVGEWWFASEAALLAARRADLPLPAELLARARTFFSDADWYEGQAQDTHALLASVPVLGGATMRFAAQVTANLVAAAAGALEPDEARYAQDRLDLCEWPSAINIALFAIAREGRALPFELLDRVAEYRIGPNVPDHDLELIADYLDRIPAA